MRNRIVIPMIALLAGLAFSSVMLAQRGIPPPDGWKACPRCQTQQDRREARAEYKVDGHPFDPHDLSGIWGYDGVDLDLKTAPPLTPWGQQQYEATKGEFGLNSKDGMLKCDPLGYPRTLTYNYGMQFVTLPDRVVQFFEMDHTWRDIWTDGRKLPEDPPEMRWFGWSVGRWEGDEFVVESTGFDDRSWLQEDYRDRTYGWPHSDEMRVVERLKRTSYGNLDVSVTIIDPKTFTKPWVTAAGGGNSPRPARSSRMTLSAGTELWEHFCAPSDNAEYNNRVLFPAAGAAPK